MGFLKVVFKGTLFESILGSIYVRKRSDDFRGYSDYDLSDYYDDEPEELEEEEWPRDHAIDRGKEELIEFLFRTQG
ncbi:MAG: hypothetical protein R3B74_09530 [Nitrospirales bacterium]|nr:hypothetical protein [Nitrospirales bacterium]